MTDDHNIETLLHESLHALDYDLSLDLSERQVHALGSSLLCLLRDNPDLIRLIAGEEEQTTMAGKKNGAHPGFAAAQKKIAAQEGISKDAAGAILASAARNASPAAKAKNPNLRKVRGK
jgi:hypothetical protein